MVDNGLAKTGYEEVGLLSLSSADHSEIAVVAKGLADRYEGTETGLSLPSTRVDAFNIELASTGWFGTDVLFLTPTDPDPIIRLTRSVESAFPDYPIYGGAYSEIHPHLLFPIFQGRV